ncbi:hypothetical protein EH31_02930 [Erythrobacter longus]|uniref:Uncharacterized protein n=1 Tax=Erythrobacter longus TaxID=1044 RepID=A0A074MA24_ERYLO|nr:hypothetical protein EH31_02930 [Erythrobacter longus]
MAQTRKRPIPRIGTDLLNNRETRKNRARQLCFFGALLGEAATANNARCSKTKQRHATGCRNIRTAGA